MKAAWLKDIGKLEIGEADEPTLQGPDEVIIKVQKVGVCGSEIHAFEGTHPYRKPPSVLGHETLGVVTEVGAAVTRFKPGDRVTVDPQWTCGECEWCLRGDHNLCPTKMVLGTANWPGAMGEYFVIPERYVFAIPDGFTDDQGVVVEPLGVAVRAVKRAHLTAGQTVLIIGGGSIGLLTSAMAHVRGASTIIVADVQPHCLEAARDLCATHTVLVGQESVADKVMEITNGRGVDVVFLTVGESSVFDVAFDSVRRQGTILVVALFPGEVSFNPYRIVGKDLQVIGTLMSTDEDFEEAMALIKSGQVQADRIISHQLSIDDAQLGFELAATKRDRAIKVVLNFD